MRLDPGDSVADRSWAAFADRRDSYAEPSAVAVAGPYAAAAGIGERDRVLLLVVRDAGS